MWQLNETSAVWNSENFSTCVQLNELGSGLTQLLVRGRPVESLRPLQLAIPCEPRGTASQLLERYVRGQDLIATFAESERGDFQPRVYWRMRSSADSSLLAAVELIVCLQTRLLDSRPSVQVTTHFAQGELLQVGQGRTLQPNGSVQDEAPSAAEVGCDLSPPQCFLFRPEGQSWSFAQIAHPSDLTELELKPVDGPGGWMRLRCGLLGHRLEKGVIRLGRMLALWVAREADEDSVESVCRDFLASDLPLTA